MPELICSRRDVSFLLYEWLGVERLTQRPPYAEHSRETFDAALDISEQIATDLFATHNRKSDLNEPTFDGQRAELHRIRAGRHERLTRRSWRPRRPRSGSS